MVKKRNMRLCEFTRFILMSVIMVFIPYHFCVINESGLLLNNLSASPPVGNEDPDPVSIAVDSGDLRITILYDNYQFQEGTIADWGFSCLIEGMEKTILFDTGTHGDILQHNISRLQVDISRVRDIVLSHQHRDHTGGLWDLLRQQPTVNVHIPISFTPDFNSRIRDLGATVISLGSRDSICSGVYLTGELGHEFPEQSLILKTGKGLIVITGCSHPGFTRILDRITRLHPEKIFLVVGGFHLLNQSEEEVLKIIDYFRNLGIEKVGCTHCTGESAISLFQREYKDNFLKMGTGRILTF